MKVGGQTSINPYSPTKKYLYHVCHQQLNFGECRLISEIDFEPLQDEAPLALSPDSRDLANYEEYLRRELPLMVRSEIEEAVRREMQPFETPW